MTSRMLRPRRAFTLIELLIVVAIIAILAAIAVPNFLEAQTRARVSRTKADIRTQAIALDAYYIDHTSYTRDSDSSLDVQGNGALPFELKANGACQLTTPIAYMTSLLSDPFGGTVQVAGGGAVGYRIASGSWSYPGGGAEDNQGSYEVFAALGKRSAYAVIGVGPDKARARMGYKCFPFMPKSDPAEGPPSTALNSKGQPFCWTTYDPTNGTTSVGDIHQFGGAYQDGHWMLDGHEIGSTPGNGVAW